MTPHKHAEAIRAWADGAIIEVNCGAKDIWSIVDHPSWALDNNYRVMPKPHPDFVKRFYLELNPLVGHRFSEAYTDKDLVNKHSLIKCTFDGETTKLKSVEII
tara:strand:+ start:683 stop:991 length:309 start_codon:yes stop_codon:yes gene_type:complete